MTVDGLALLREFHSLIRLDAPEKMPPAGPLSQATAALRVDLVTEEVCEIFDAYLRDDLIETADGIADSLYVVYGTLEAAGIAQAERVRNDVWGESSVAELLAVVTECSLEFVQLVKNLPECPERSVELPESGDRLVRALNAYAGVWGIPIEEVFVEVHSSNMTKRFLEENGELHFRFHPNGKGMKPDTYTPADVAGVLERHRG